MAADIHQAIAEADTHPKNASTSPSAKSSRTTRPRDAPRERRTANSRPRTMTRPSIKLDTFAQTISNVIAVTTEKTAKNSGTRCATTLSPPAVMEYGTGAIDDRTAASPRADARADSTAYSARAIANEASGDSRPMTQNLRSILSASAAAAPLSLP